jgi:hypothetical protein
MISIPNRRRRLLFCGATAKHGHESLEQGALTLGALAVLTAIWLGIGLPSLPSAFSHHSAYENESPLVAFANDPAQPRPHTAPSSPLGITKAVRRQGGKPAPHLVQATSASGRRATAAAAAPMVSPSGTAQPRLEAAAPKHASAAAPAREAAAQPAAPQAAASPETVAAPRATTTVTTTSTTTTTQTSTTETPGTPPPPVTVPSLPDLPDLPDLPLPNVPPLPPVPPVPTVEVPQVPEVPPLPGVEPPSQLPPVPTQTLPTLP